MSLKCYYHPEKKAQSKCEKCGKPICLECKRAFYKTHGISEYTPTIRHEFCQICYFNLQLSIVKKTSTYCFICILTLPVILIFSIAVPYSMRVYNIEFFISGEFIVLIISSISLLISIILFLYAKFIYSPKKIAKIRAEKNNYLRSIKKSLVKKDVVILICQKCGKKIDSNILICPYCGSDIED